jgi:uncharacterized protein (UPF0332 family)
MPSDIAIQAFWDKALEKIDSAASELVNRRYNAAANRAYYAVFHAAIVALLRSGIQPPGAQWEHGFVQAQFSGQLVTRRKAYPTALRDALPRLAELRERADYGLTQVSRIQAERAVRHAQEFIEAIERGGKVPTLLSDPRIQEAVEELRTLIAGRYPTARFDVFERDDPEGVRLQAMVDIEDTDEVMDAVMDALYDIQVERGLPVYMVTEQPPARVAEQLRERSRRASPVA